VNLVYMARSLLILGVLNFAALTAFGQSRVAALAASKDSLHQLSESIEALSQAVSPAVVEVCSTGYTLSDEESEGGGDTATAGLVTKQRSSGSGIVLSADGYIVTNN